MLHRLLLIPALAASLSALGAPVQDTLLFTTELPQRPLGAYLAVFRDTTGLLTADQVLQSEDFVPANRAVPNLDITPDAFWVKLIVRNTSPCTEMVLSIPHAEIDEIDIHLASHEGVQHIASAGQSRPRSECFGMYGKEFAAKLPMAPGSTAEVLVRVRSVKQLQVPVLLMTDRAFAEERAVRNLRVGLFMGVILVLILYNLFVGLAMRQSTYIKYIVYLLLVGLTQLAFTGFAPAYMWPGSVWLSKNASLLLTLATATAGGQFMRSFLDTRTTVPRLNRGISIFYLVFAATAAFYLFGKPHLGYRMAQGVSGLFAFYFFYTVFRIWRTGSRQAGYFLIAWTVFLAGTMVFVMKDTGILPYNDLTNYTMPLGSAIEGILLSFALADRINVLRREKERSQAEALATAEENARITRDQNTMLEMKVVERTEQLQQSLDQLKRTQSKLVEAERMSSLGQLTAGIAHEINNPVNYIRSNIPPLKRDMDDILEVLGAYRTNGTSASVAEMERSLGLDETIDEVRAIMRSIEEGADRTAEIVRGLRSFSRLDEDVLKTAFVSEGLRSTLNILRPQIKAGIELELDLNTPEPVECYPGKLNQVFMNVLANAIQAVAARPGTQEGRIQVTARQSDCHTEITVSDNGIGMSPEVKARIFEPFFTTKNVGEGTGLGLSIAHSIIEMHNGRIEVESTEGEGTVFRIILPTNQTMALAKRA